MKDKKITFLVGVILFALATFTFFIVDITTNFMLAYAFALFGIAIWIVSNMLTIQKMEWYPWVLAIPIKAIVYLIIEIIVSIIVVALEQFDVYTLKPFVFALVHLVILMIFVVQIVLLDRGTKYIDDVEKNIENKTAFIKRIQVEVDVLSKRYSEITSDDCNIKLRNLCEKIRYSDVVSDDGLQELEGSIESEIDGLKRELELGNYESVMPLIIEIEKLLEERNAKCKELKSSRKMTV